MRSTPSAGNTLRRQLRTSHAPKVRLLNTSPEQSREQAYFRRPLSGPASGAPGRTRRAAVRIPATSASSPVHAHPRDSRRATARRPRRLRIPQAWWHTGRCRRTPPAAPGGRSSRPGRPAASASIAASPKPSLVDGKAKRRRCGDQAGQLIVGHRAEDRPARCRVRRTAARRPRGSPGSRTASPRPRSPARHPERVARRSVIRVDQVDGALARLDATDCEHVPAEPSRQPSRREPRASDAAPMNRCATNAVRDDRRVQPPLVRHLCGHGRGHADAGVRLDHGLLVTFRQHRRGELVEVVDGPDARGRRRWR